MIELKRDKHGGASPVMTCDVCFEPITDASDAEAVWNSDELHLVYIVHRCECLKFSMRLCGMDNMRIMSLRNYMNHILESIGYLLFLVMAFD
jgi:hypothetical protein